MTWLDYNLVNIRQTLLSSSENQLAEHQLTELYDKVLSAVKLAEVDKVCFLGQSDNGCFRLPVKKVIII